MKHALDPNWQPDPQLLAAYFDGELEGRDDVADLRARLEAWLDANPQAADEWAMHQQLQKLMRETTPAEPSPSAWRRTRERIDAGRKRPASLPAVRRPWLAAGIVAASIVILAGLLFGTLRAYFATVGQGDPIVKQAPPINPDRDDFEILDVARADEITILRIEDADAAGMVVGTFPVSGNLELADPGEVCISCKCPRVIVRQDPTHRPMVFARVDAE